MNTIDASYYLKNQQKSNVPTSELGKDQFMKILVAQMQNQDPTNPMDDRDFIAQMAQFSSLEQMMNMSKSIDMLVQSQMVSPVIQYSHMIGKHVQYEKIDEETGDKLGIHSGKVVSVTQKEGWAILELDDGEKVFADGVLKVSDKAFDSKDEPETKPDVNE